MEKNLRSPYVKKIKYDGEVSYSDNTQMNIPVILNKEDQLMHQRNENIKTLNT